MKVFNLRNVMILLLTTTHTCDLFGQLITSLSLEGLLSLSLTYSCPRPTKAPRDTYRGLHQPFVGFSIGILC